MLLRILKLRHNLLLLIFNFIISVLESVLVLVQVSCIRDVIDSVANKDLQSLQYGLILLGGVIIFTILARMLNTYSKSVFKIRFRNDMSIYLFENYLSSDYMGQRELHSGDVMSRIIQDIGNVTGFISSTLPQIVSNVFLLVGSFIYLCCIYWPLAVCVIIVSPLFLILGRRYLSKMDYYSKELRHCETRAQTMFQEIVQNRLVIKINKVVGYVKNRYVKLSTDMEEVVVKQTRYSVGMDMLMLIGFNICYILTLGWGGWLLYEDVITFGAMAAILQLTDSIQRPSQTLAGLIPMWSGYSVARKRLSEIISNSTESTASLSLEPPLGIKFDNVSFSYNDKEATKEDSVLKDFSYYFKPGSFTIVRGKSGAGKTTLLNLILAVYKPDKGVVYACDAKGEVPINQGIRNYIEYVPQGNHVLSGTVEENLRLGKPDANTAEMEEALRIACADFVLSNPDGMNACCGENGVGFSEGQSQRIVVARALLRNCPIIILDEATSALDIQTERQLLDNLRTMSTKTIIFVTHRTHFEHIGDAILNL